MKMKVRQIGMGLLFGFFVVISHHGHAQITKSIKNVTNTVTKPMKDVRTTTQSVTQPVRDVSTGVRDVTRAPQDVKNEFNRTTSEFDRAKNDVNRVGSDIKRSKDGLGIRGGNRNNQQDSTAAKKAGAGNNRTVVIDERRDRDVPGNDEKLDISKNPELPQSTGKTTTKAPDPFQIGAPAKKAEPAPTAGERTVEVVPEGAIAQPRPKRIRPDYSNSPARYALERAEFDAETLEDLFASAEWEGPGREHTIRSIEFTLKQLKNDIAEVKQIDQNADTSYFERRYKEWYAEFTRRTREEPAKNEAVIQDL